MALTEFQRAICRLLAQQRIQSGESYVAGGVALSELLGAARISRDIDLFHDTEEAVEASWEADSSVLLKASYSLQVFRQRPGFVEAEVSKDTDVIRMEWARDSAYRFFPLIEHSELGLALHPFDLATNKVLALVGRREVRDWVDVLECDRGLQPLGYLAWAACGKDPGFSPVSILEHAARMARFTSGEVAELAFSGSSPHVSDLSRSWHEAMEAARRIVEVLPAEESGTCVLLGPDLCRLDPEELPTALGNRHIRFRSGSIRGVMPTFRP